MKWCLERGREEKKKLGNYKRGKEKNDHFLSFLKKFLIPSKMIQRNRLFFLSRIFPKESEVRI